MRRFDCHRRLKDVQSSYHTALKAVRVFIDIAKSQPDLLYDNGLDLADLYSIEAELPSVFLTRMFAGFESIVRSFWRTNVRDTKPLTEVLLNCVAQRRGVPQDAIDAAHDIRDCRNSLMHDDHEIERPYTIDEACKCLNRYLSWLPDSW